MRRRITLLSSTVALLLAFILPASTVSATTFYYTVKSNTCTASGGDWGYGHLYFKVKLSEPGNSGANKFTFAALAQHRRLGSSRWITSWNAGTFTYRFPSDSDSYWYTRWWAYDPPDFAWHRFKVTLKVWSGSFLMASHTLYGKTC